MTDAIGNGKVVSVTYTLHDEHGQLFEQSDLPVPYLHGHASGLFDKIEQQLKAGAPATASRQRSARKKVSAHTIRR